MERQSSHVFVGGAVLIVVGLALVVTVWLVRIDHGNREQYDIFFESSTEGLSTGSIVTFLGVPVGKVIIIKLLPPAPQFVWVRISVDHNRPILRGTTARIANVGITGLKTIDLSGGWKGAPPIGDAGELGMPVIPARRAPLAFAPDVLNKAAVDAHRLGELLGGSNIRSIHHILGNVDRLAAAMAGRDPQFDTTLSSTRAAFRQAKGAIRTLSTTRNILVDRQARSVAVDLREAARSVRRFEEDLGYEIAESRSAVKMSAKRTTPKGSQRGRNLSSSVDTLAKIGKVGKTNSLGALVSGHDLPDYRPHKSRIRKVDAGRSR